MVNFACQLSIPHVNGGQLFMQSLNIGHMLAHNCSYTVLFNSGHLLDVTNDMSDVNKVELFIIIPTRELTIHS